ncbi:MAG: hypothetical protein KDE33_08085 [Bacteroidetes bacterium]|nr:hypothetical protein [Bacteroidota bacterium]
MANIKNPTLIIGLGGTGFHCISRVKSFIKEEFNTIPSGIKFLGVDFDSVENNKNQYKKIFKGVESILDASGDISNEWIRISSGRDVDYELSIRMPQENADLRYFENDETKKNVLLNTIGGFDLSVGAGQKRVLGKIGISYSTNYDRVKGKIEDAIRPLETVNIEGNLNWDTISILLVNSFSGGAGAGMFLDILFMLNNLSVAGKNIEILTFNFLPDVFLNGLSTNIFKNLVEPNTYAAITELEHIYSNVSEFRPTNHRNSLESTKTLPKANFLINQGSYNGAKMSLKSMIYSTSKTMFNLVLAGNGLDTQWSNFQAHMSGNIKGKNRIFCSLGYSEIVFDIEKLKQYSISSILKKAWDNYNNYNLEPTTKKSFDITVLENFKINYRENLLTNNKNDKSFGELYQDINFSQPSASKKAFARLKETIQQCKTDFENEILDTVRVCYESSKVLNLIDAEKEKIRISSFKKSEIHTKLNSFKEKLSSLKINLDNESNYQNKKMGFEQKYNKALEDINKIPKRYKSFFGWTKSDFYKKVLIERIRTVKNLIETEFADIVLEMEISRLFNNDIDNGISSLSNIENDNFGKLQWINSNNKVTYLSQNYDNIIFLESYFQRHIDDKISNDSEINASIIESYLSQDGDFINSIRHTSTMQYLTQLESKNLYELKELLTEDEQNQIINKISELINPLWDRANTDEINVGRTNASGRLISFNRIEVPALKDNTIGSYFGKGSFDINDGDIFPSDNIHRQSFIKLELGLPAYLVKNMKKYKDTFDDEINDNINSSVNYFAYNEIRNKVLNGDTGIFVFADDEELAKQTRAMYVWAFGWAMNLIIKENQRIKVKVSDNFTVTADNQDKIENGIYDAFKDFGQSADLLRIFNALKEDSKLLDDIEALINSEKSKSNEAFLKQVAKTFEETSPTDKKQKFRTEKKAYSQLNNEEKHLLNVKEQEALKLGCEEIANSNSIKIDFYYEAHGNEKYLRLKVN